MPFYPVPDWAAPYRLTVLPLLARAILRDDHRVYRAGGQDQHQHAPLRSQQDRRGLNAEKKPVNGSRV